MAGQIVFCLLLAFLATASSKSVNRNHPDVGLDVFELAAKHGYPMENHEVTTEDGYILGMQRISHGRTNNFLENRPPILLMHGLTSCSADWINIGPEKSLAYKLADLGYDVWLGNARGNAHSRKHIHLNPDEDVDEFWSFSWNEIGRFDLPAKIDYILDLTGVKQLQYVGFSQGTTSFFVMASSHPEYNEKIKLATNLAPVAEMSYFKHPLNKLLAPFEEILFSAAKSLGIYEILPRSKQVDDLSESFCGDGKATQEICKILLFAIAGYDREQLEGSFIPVVTTNTPAGCNLKQFVHYAQVINAKEFRNFDFHNETLNQEKYGSPIPPKYDLGKITAPVALYYGENDWLASDTDAQNIAKIMPNVVRAKLVDYKAFNHIDFIFAIDIVDLLNKDVIELIEQYK